MLPTLPSGKQSQTDLFANSVRDLARLIDPDAQSDEVDLRTPDGIVCFVRDVLGIEPTVYQEEILRDFVEHRRIAVRGPHGLGKTALSSWVVLWGIAAFADTDVKVITTASAWRQLIHFTWPEIRKWAGRADWGRLGLNLRRGKEVLELSIKAGEREAFAVASDNPAFIEGAHASVIIYVFDEAKAIPADIWDAAEGAFSTAGDDTEDQAFALAISTPGQTSGRFYDICQHKRGYEDWKTRHVRLQEAIAAGRISQDWAEGRKNQWGEKSGVYKNRVLGEFDDSGTDNIIPLAWVEKANERWYALMGDPTKKEKLLKESACYGVDPAYKGADATTIAELRKHVILDVKAFANQDTMATAGRVAALINGQTPVGIDSIGIGAGIYGRLVEQGYRNVISVDVRHKAVLDDKELTDITGTVKFINLRAFIWWMMRDLLDPDYDDPIALPPIDELTGDLTAPRWSYRSDGRVKVESKDDLRERLGRSTDYADAVGLALFVASFIRPLTIAIA